MIDGLIAKGFKYRSGPHSAGIYRSAIATQGAKYIGMVPDAHRHPSLADGRIKMRGESELERFTERGALFKDGSELKADVIILATG